MTENNTKEFLEKRKYEKIKQLINICVECLEYEILTVFEVQELLKAILILF